MGEYEWYWQTTCHIAQDGVFRFLVKRHTDTSLIGSGAGHISGACPSCRYQFALSISYRCCTFAAAVTLIIFSYCRCADAAVTSKATSDTTHSCRTDSRIQRRVSLQADGPLAPRSSRWCPQPGTLARRSSTAPSLSWGTVSLTVWTWTGNIRKEATTRRTSCCCWRVRMGDCVRPTGAYGSVRSRNEYIEGYVCVWLRETHWGLWVCTVT